MKIEHVAIYVKDLEAARDFFVTYLGGTSNDGYHNPNTGFRSYFINFDDGARLELMAKPGIDDRTKCPEELKNAGYEVVGRPRYTGDGYYESCIAAVEGDLIEITE